MANVDLPRRHLGVEAHRSSVLRHAVFLAAMLVLLAAGRTALGQQCGDGICAPGVEDCGVCPGDCPCPDGQSCVDRQCKTPPAACGDGTCAPGVEDCGLCPSDCPCPTGQSCSNRQCQAQQCGTASCGAGCAYKPAFSVSATQVNANQEVVFTAAAELIDDPSPKWDLGNGVHLEGNPLVYRYPDAGTYNVILTATDRNCHTAQLSDPVRVTVSTCGDGTCEDSEMPHCLADCGRCRRICQQGPPEQPPFCDYDCTEVQDAAVTASNLPTTLTCGVSYTASITMKNTGSSTWTALEGYALAVTGGGDLFGNPALIGLPGGVSIPPQWSHTFHFTMTGPSANGSQVASWRMVRGVGEWRFGDTAQTMITYTKGACGGSPPGGGGGGSGPPLRGNQLTVRLDDGTYVIVTNASSYTADQARSLVLRADRSTRSNCPDTPALEGLIDGARSEDSATVLGDKLFLSDNYLAWFDYTKQDPQSGHWGGHWTRSGALAGWWTLHPLAKDFRYKLAGRAGCGGWAPNELLPGSASPNADATNPTDNRFHWDKYSPPSEQCLVTIPNCPHPCTPWFYCYHYAQSAGAWLQVEGQEPVPGGERYLTVGKMARGYLTDDPDAPNPVYTHETRIALLGPGDTPEYLDGKFIDASVEYVATAQGVRVIWKFKPDADLDAGNLFMYLWAGYAQDLDVAGCTSPPTRERCQCDQGPGNEWPDAVFRRFHCHQSNMETRRQPDGDFFGPFQTARFSLPAACGSFNTDIFGSDPGDGDFVTLADCDGGPKWRFTVKGQPGGSGTSWNPERIVWPRITTWNENRGDGSMGFGVDAVGNTYHLQADRWYVAEYFLESVTSSTSGGANRAPVAHAGGPYTAADGQTVVFDGTGSRDPEGDLAQYEWNFGDGAEGAGPQPQHAYSGPGTYEVALTVRDGAGLVSSATSAVQVRNPPPAVLIETSGLCDATSCAVTFRATGHDGEAGTWTYAWSGCASGAADRITCTTSLPRPLAATVRIEDGHGGSATASAEVTVRATGYLPGPWGACTGAGAYTCTSTSPSGCTRPGLQARPVRPAVLTVEPGEIVPPPASSQACTEVVPGYVANYAVGAWDGCSASCGGGEQHRTVTPSTWKAVPPHAGRPADAQSCNTDPCPQTCGDHGLYESRQDCEGSWRVCEIRYRDDGIGGLLRCWKGFD